MLRRKIESPSSDIAGHKQTLTVPSRVTIRDRYKGILVLPIFAPQPILYVFDVAYVDALPGRFLPVDLAALIARPFFIFTCEAAKVSAQPTEGACNPWLWRSGTLAECKDRQAALPTSVRVRSAKAVRSRDSPSVGVKAASSI
jgi:hypothetical protein